MGFVDLCVFLEGVGGVLHYWLVGCSLWYTGSF